MWCYHLWSVDLIALLLLIILYTQDMGHFCAFTISSSWNSSFAKSWWLTRSVFLRMYNRCFSESRCSFSLMDQLINLPKQCKSICQTKLYGFYYDSGRADYKLSRSAERDHAQWEWLLWESSQTESSLRELFLKRRLMGRMSSLGTKPVQNCICVLKDLVEVWFRNMNLQCYRSWTSAEELHHFILRQWNYAEC